MQPRPQMHSINCTSHSRCSSTTANRSHRSVRPHRRHTNGAAVSWTSLRWPRQRAPPKRQLFRRMEHHSLAATVVLACIGRPSSITAIIIIITITIMHRHRIRNAIRNRLLVKVPTAMTTMLLAVDTANSRLLAVCLACTVKRRVCPCTANSR